MATKTQMSCGTSVAPSESCLHGRDYQYSVSGIQQASKSLWQSVIAALYTATVALDHSKSAEPRRRSPDSRWALSAAAVEQCDRLHSHFVTCTALQSGNGVHACFMGVSSLLACGTLKPPLLVATGSRLQASAGE